MRLVAFRGMSDVWFTVATPAMVGAATVLYTAGGRAALARRAIKEELDIVSLLPKGVERGALERIARERTLLYALRWIGPQRLSLRHHLVLGGIGFVGALGTWVAAHLTGRASGHLWAETPFLLIMLLGLSGMAFTAVAWVALVAAAENATTRAETVSAARRRSERWRGSA